MWADPKPTRDKDYESLLASQENGGVAVEGTATSTSSGRSWRKAGAALLGCASLVALVLAWPHAASWRAQADVSASMELAAAPCAASGADCRASQCCQNGGKSGLQCYTRDDNWAQCGESCEPGIHKDDPTTVFDQSGKQTKPSWTCKPLGDRSKAACASYEKKSKCPTSRCEWKNEECVEPCWLFANASCTAQDKCYWDGSDCLDACWTMGDNHTCLTKKHRKRCSWKGTVLDEGGKCAQGCWMFGTKDACGWSGDSMCMWNGTCVDDPCSGPGENCLETKCCSGARGGGGMTCFKKDKYYATCAKACPEDDWSCKELGNRTMTQTHCAWAGESCAETGMCCNKGMVCGVKDQYFTGCVQIWKETSFKQVKLPMPPGWPANPKIIGGAQFEYAVQPVSQDKAMGTSLYCFMAYLPGSYEERLMEIAKASYASVFACDAHDLFHTWQSSVSTWDTQAATLTNIDVFINVWENVKKKGTLWKYDWTVKVDPDCLIVPQRLKWHLAAMNAPTKQPIYVKNNNLNASIGNNGFLGAVEVFSREALELYYDWYPKCKATIGINGGEDGFMKGCMDALGVGFVTDGYMFKPDNNPQLCKDGKYAAYHPLKIQDNLQCCIEQVNGWTDHTFEWGKCTNLDSKWINKVWPNCTDGASCRQPMWR